METPAKKQGSSISASKQQIIFLLSLLRPVMEFLYGLTIFPVCHPQGNEKARFLPFLPKSLALFPDLGLITVLPLSVSPLPPLLSVATNPLSTWLSSPLRGGQKARRLIRPQLSTNQDHPESTRTS